MWKNLTILCLFSLLLSACGKNLQSLVPHSGKILENPEAKIYLPASLEEGKKHPIFFVFSPTADADSSVSFWRELAEKHKFIVWASTEYKNNIDMDALHPKIKQGIDKALRELPVDKSKVVFTGLSGGGSFSHMLNLKYPYLAYAVIANTGRLWDFVFEEAQQKRPDLTLYFKNYPKKIVFLASKTDFRYKEMIRDESLLRSLGGTTYWIEFEGGHKMAPQTVYEEALKKINL